MSNTRSGSGDWTTLTARDVMVRDVVTIPYSAPLSEVERVLVDHRISGMPVTDATGHVVGVVSVKDLIERYAEEPESRPRRGSGYFHLSSAELDDDFDSFELPAEAEDTAESVMNAQVFMVDSETPLRAVAAVMAEHGIHRVLVQEPRGVVGIISTLEVLRAVAG